MSLTAADIKLYKPANISDTSANGGIITTVELTDVVGALFANVDNTERTTGSSKWRKLFFKLHNNGIDPLIASRVFMDKDTGGSDTVMFAAGTKEDTQANINSTHVYGSFALSQSVLAGATEIKATLPAGLTNPFFVGEVLRVTNKANVSANGDEDFVTVTAMSGSSSMITLTVSPALNSTYTESTTKIAGVYSHGDLVASVSDLVMSSVSGSLDISRIECNNKSTVDSVWTLSFTSSTAFNVSSSTLGSMGAGNIISSPFSVNNPTYSLPYFSIPNGAFSGTFTAGDTVNFTTSSATLAIWVKRIVPVNSTPTAVNKAVFVLDGGSI